MIMRIDYKPIYLVITPFFPSAQSFRGPYVYDQVKAIMCDGRYRVIVMMPDSWMHKVGEYEYDGINVHRLCSMTCRQMRGRGRGIISVYILLAKL